MSEFRLEAIERKKAVKRHENAKQKIFHAALKLLEAYGYEYLTVSNICKAAGVSNGSFYHYFSSKDHLLQYYFFASFEKYQKEFDAIGSADGVADLLECYRICVQFLLEQSLDFLRNYYNPKNKGLDTHHGDINGTDQVLPVYGKSVELIQQAINRGDLRADTDAEMLGEDMCTIEKGLVFDYGLSDGGFDLEKRSLGMLKNYLRAFVTDEYLKEHPKVFI